MIRGHATKTPATAGHAPPATISIPANVLHGAVIAACDRKVAAMTEISPIHFESVADMSEWVALVKGRSYQDETPVEIPVGDSLRYLALAALQDNSERIVRSSEEFLRYADGCPHKTGIDGAGASAINDVMDNARRVVSWLDILDRIGWPDADLGRQYRGE